MSSPEHSLNPQGFANPYLVCAQCRVRVTSRPGMCNVPCGHAASYESLCPSWSPVGGCQCLEMFGSVIHELPS